MLRNAAIWARPLNFLKISVIHPTHQAQLYRANRWCPLVSVWCPMVGGVPAVVRPSRPAGAAAGPIRRSRPGARPSRLLAAAAAAAAGRRRSASASSAPARRRPAARAARPPATRSRAWSQGRRRCRPASSTPGASGPGRGLEPSLQFLSSLPRSRRYLSSAVAPLPRRCRGCLRVKPRAPLWAPLVLPRPLFLGKSLLSRLQQGQQKLDKADALRLLSSVLPLAAIRPLLLAP